MIQINFESWASFLNQFVTFTAATDARFGGNVETVLHVSRTSSLISQMQVRNCKI
jgi:hypothetical protein